MTLAKFESQAYGSVGLVSPYDLPPPPSREAVTPMTVVGLECDPDRVLLLRLHVSSILMYSWCNTSTFW